MNLEQALEERLKIINCKPQDIKNFIKAHPPASRMAAVSHVAVVLTLMLQTNKNTMP